MAEENKKEEAKQDKKQGVAVAQQHINMVADLESGVFSSSDTLRIARSFAEDLAKSTMIPLQYQNNYANCLVAIEYANRTGQSPLQVMQSLDVIKGTPSWRAKALIGMVNASGKYDEDLQYSYTRNAKGEVDSCYVWTKKDGVVVEGIPYTLAKAKAEGLLDKSNSYWSKDPELMLTYRAVSRFVSTNCPEISLGLYTSEEVRDMNFTNGKTKGKASLNSILSDDTDDLAEYCEVVDET